VAILSITQIEKAKKLLVSGADMEDFRLQEVPLGAMRAALLELMASKQDPESLE